MTALSKGDGGVRDIVVDDVGHNVPTDNGRRVAECRSLVIQEFAETNLRAMILPVDGMSVCETISAQHCRLYACFTAALQSICGRTTLV